MDRVFRTAAVAFLSGLVFAPAAVAAPTYAPNSVIVKYADGASATKRSLVDRAAGVLQTLGQLTGVGAQLVRVTGDPAKVAAQLNRSANVVYAEPNYIYRATTIPNDPRFAEQYALNNTGQNGGTADVDIDAPEGWDTPALGAGAFSTTLNGAKIGFVDTGVQAAHEDLAGKVVNCAGVRSFGILLGLFADPTIVANKCSDDNGHGTHVAGTAAAWTNNARGGAGVAFNSPLAICKALDSAGAGSLAGVANCIAYLANNGAKVISMSLGGAASTTLKNAVSAASQSALIVAASGNGGNATLTYPAGYPEVVSVAAVDRSGARASFSTFNADVEIAAPGVDILSTWNNGGYNTISGTSMATPHVAGVAAIIAGKGGGPSDWRAQLDTSVDGPGGRSPEIGFGRVSLQKAAS
jgi:thermitase